MKPLYTAIVTAKGGRDGRVHADATRGNIDVKLVVVAS
jgi:hypothetical protein